jgi:hypothetical protein
MIATKEEECMTFAKVSFFLQYAKCNIATMRTFSLAFGLIAIINESMELGM